nr:hypothetical protein [Rathayibacter rathayi]
MALFFDGSRSLHEAVEIAGVGVDDAQAREAVEALASAGLLHTHQRRRFGTGRFTYRRPLSFQWVLFDPTPAARALSRPFQTRVGRSVVLALFVVVLLLAVLSAAQYGELLVSMLSGPIPLDLVLYLGLAIVVVGGLHEFGHAVALAAFGGRPTRMGVMLFYFTPAFFCDVTDGWRIHERSRRAAVALAGPAIHVLAGAVSLCILSLVSDNQLRQFFAVFALACVVSVGTNLIPLIKLDGYLALVAVTDTPNLRTRAMTAAEGALARLLFGVENSAEKKPRSAIFALYGALCWLFPVFLFVWAAYRLQPILLNSGPWTAACYLLLVLGFIAGLLRKATLFVLSSLRRRLRWARTGIGFAVSVAIGAAVLLVPVSSAAHCGFVVVEGRVYLVATTLSLLEDVDAGNAVQLRSNGVVATPILAVGEAGTSGWEARELNAPLEAVAPISDRDLTVPVLGIPLVVSNGLENLPRAGAAEVDLGDSISLGSRLVHDVVEEPLATIFGGDHQ